MRERRARELLERDRLDRERRARESLEREKQERESRERARIVFLPPFPFPLRDGPFLGPFPGHFPGFLAPRVSSENRMVIGPGFLAPRTPFEERQVLAPGGYPLPAHLF